MSDLLEDPEVDALVTAFGMLLEAHGALRAVLTHELEAACGIPASWYGVLLRLARSPGNRLRMSDLAAGVSLTASGTTRLVDRIEAAGLIRRVACPQDRRVAWTELTPKGREVLAKATPVHVRGLREHLGAHLSARELATLTDLLRRLRDANLPAR
jgi:MarR family 2-MHQ and catechol resistance regulon transcriptional repressor